MAAAPVRFRRHDYEIIKLPSNCATGSSLIFFGAYSPLPTLTTRLRTYQYGQLSIPVLPRSVKWRILQLQLSEGVDQ
jgi:hypothetical protein